MSSMRCAAVLVLYSRSRLAAATAAATRIDRHLHFSRLVTVVNEGELDAAEVGRDMPLARRGPVLAHDNRGQEFGAWQRGLAALEGAFDWVVLLNDTVGTHNAVSLAHLSAFRRRLLADSPPGQAVGKINQSRQQLELRGLSTDRWLRTHFFAMDARALQALDGTIHVPALDALIRATPDPSAFFDPAVGPGLCDRIGSWLFSTRGDRWYGAEPLTSANCERMARKARSILQEKYLSMRLLHAGVQLAGPQYRPDEFMRHALSYFAHRQMALLRG